MICDFFFLDYLKSRVYKLKSCTLGDMKNKIRTNISKVNEKLPQCVRSNCLDQHVSVTKKVGVICLMSLKKKLNGTYKYNKMFVPTSKVYQVMSTYFCY